MLDYFVTLVIYKPKIFLALGLFEIQSTFNEKNRKYVNTWTRAQAREK